MSRQHHPIAHPRWELVERYIHGDQDLDQASVWTLEAHLETCSTCRDQLAADVYAGTPPSPASDPVPHIATGGSPAALLKEVSAALAQRIDAEPAPAPPVPSWLRARQRWAVWSFLPWLLMTGLVLLAALVLDRIAPNHPSLVLLLAPVAPLLGVAAAWNRRTDAAWELVAGSPRSGLWLLLRRTLAVLVVVIPLFMLASWAGRQSPVVWLLPCLVLTTMTLAAGSRFGVHRSASAIAVIWAVGVLTPALVTGQVPVVLDPASLRLWAALGVAAAAVIVLRSGDYRHLTSRQ